MEENFTSLSIKVKSDLTKMEQSIKMTMSNRTKPAQTKEGPSRIFQQGITKLHTASITTGCLHSKRVQTDLPAPELKPSENIWSVIIQKIRKKKTQDY